MFIGTHNVGVDQKGRVSIPASFRAAMKGADTVFVWPSYRGAFLEAGDHALLDRYRHALQARGEFDAVREDFEYSIFAEAEALECDSTGRVTLPERLRTHARLEGKAAFTGLSDRFEIWSPPLLEARVAAARDKAAEGRALLRRAGP